VQQCSRQSDLRDAPISGYTGVLRSKRRCAITMDGVVEVPNNLLGDARHNGDADSCNSANPLS